MSNLNKNIGLKEIERRAWASQFQDGLLEIAVGAIMLVAVLSATLDAVGVSDEVRISVYAPLMIIIPMAIVMLGKWYVTRPRLGVVRFGTRRKATRRALFAGLICIQLILLAMLVLQWVYAVGSGWLGLALVTLNIFVAFSLIAHLLENRRMYVVGALFAASEVAMTLLKHYTDTVYRGLVAYGIPAVVIIAIGSVALRRFMKEYGVPTEASPDANR